MSCSEDSDGLKPSGGSESNSVMYLWGLCPCAGEILYSLVQEDHGIARNFNVCLGLS